MNNVEKVFKALNSLLDRICRACWQIAGIAVLVMAFVITYNVISRYAFRYQNPYAYVISCILMLSCIVLSIAYTQRLGQHLRVDLIDRYAPELLRRVLVDFVGPFLGLICISILAWKSWQPAWFAFVSGDTQGSGLARWPTWPWRMMVTVGAGLLCLTLLAQVIRFFASLRGKPSEGKK